MAGRVYPNFYNGAILELMATSAWSLPEPIME
jgi:hypothetical protein